MEDLLQNFSQQPTNLAAVIAKEKLVKLISKNLDLTKIVKILQGDLDSDHPFLFSSFVFAPVTSVDVEGFFSVLKVFQFIRPHSVLKFAIY